MKSFLYALLSFVIIVAIGFSISLISDFQPSTVDFLKRYWLWILGAIIIVLLILALWILPKLQISPSVVTDPKDRLTLENEARKTLAQVIGGLVLLTGLYFTWQTILSQQETLQLAQEGQITERFTRAIDQLGSDKLEIRLGGIYALERIAKDSEKDHWTIIEVLTTFVRENAHWSLQGNQLTTKSISQKDKLQDVEKLLKPNADIQAILTVIGRRNTAYEKENQYLNLIRTDLSGSYLFQANLQRALLIEANLQKASLFEAELRDANLTEADLQGAVELNIKGLCSTRTLYGIKGLDSSDIEQIKKDCPRVLEEP